MSQWWQGDFDDEEETAAGQQSQWSSVLPSPTHEWRLKLGFHLRPNGSGPATKVACDPRWIHGWKLVTGSWTKHDERRCDRYFNQAICRSWIAKAPSHRQRVGVQCQRDSGSAGQSWSRNAVYWYRHPVGERLLGKFQQSFPRRVSCIVEVRDLDSGPDANWYSSDELQQRAASQLTRLQEPNGTLPEKRSLFFNQPVLS